MDISNWSNRDLIRFLTSRSAVTQAKLSEEVFKKLGRDVLPSAMTNRIKRNGLKLEEFQVICELLGYRLILEEVEKVINPF